MDNDNEEAEAVRVRIGSERLVAELALDNRALEDVISQ